MQSYSLTVKKREIVKIPRHREDVSELLGVVYGPGIETTPVVADAKIAKKIFTDAGTSHIIQLHIDNNSPIDVLLKDSDIHPVSKQIRHFDLYAVKKGARIDVEIPVVLVGEAPAAKLGHVVHQLIDTVEVRTEPAHIPESIQVDISNLNEVGDSITFSQLNISQHVELDPDMVEQAVVKIDAVEELVVEDQTAEVSVEDVASEHGVEVDETAEEHSQESQP